MRLSVNQNKLIQTSGHGPNTGENRRKEEQSTAKQLPGACEFIAAEMPKVWVCTVGWGHFRMGL